MGSEPEPTLTNGGGGDPTSYWFDAAEDDGLAAIDFMEFDPSTFPMTFDDGYFGEIDKILESISSDQNKPAPLAPPPPATESPAQEERPAENGSSKDEEGKPPAALAKDRSDANGDERCIKKARIGHGDRAEGGGYCPPKRDNRYREPPYGRDHRYREAYGMRRNRDRQEIDRRRREWDRCRKRERDWDRRDGRDRDWRDKNRDRDRDRESRGYWERDAMGKLVFRTGSWESDSHNAKKARLENPEEGNKGPEKEEKREKPAEEQARKYQLDVLAQAKEKNTIAFLETGAGKTLIAVLLIKSIYTDMLKEGKNMLAIFLVPKVPLVYQQAEVIREKTGYKVGHYCGEMGQDFWDSRRWHSEFESKQVIGLGTLIVTPLIGNLSDKYGRKALLTIPMTVGIIPTVILAYDRSRPFFYAYYGIKTFTGMFCDGSMQCLSLAYVADRVAESRRASAFGILTGISAAGFVSGTIAARFLQTSYIFQVSAAVAVLAAVYMRFFLAESNGGAASVDECSEPLCPPRSSDADSSSPKLEPIKNLPSLRDMICLLRSSVTLLRAALVTFFGDLGGNGLQAAVLYFLKAKFHYDKDQFADLLLIVGIAGAFSQLFLMPTLTRFIGEEKLLSIGLLAGCTHIFLYSIAWASWVPYLASMFIVMGVFVGPCIRSTVSKAVGTFEQGMAQGCITAISSLAGIISPLVFTPLTALFLSESAPFDFKGFSIMCCGFASLAAFTLSIAMRETLPISSKSTHNTIEV